MDFEFSKQQEQNIIEIGQKNNLTGDAVSISVQLIYLISNYALTVLPSFDPDNLGNHDIDND